MIMILKVMIMILTWMKMTIDMNFSVMNGFIFKDA